MDGDMQDDSRLFQQSSEKDAPFKPGKPGESLYYSESRNEFSQQSQIVFQENRPQQLLIAEGGISLLSRHNLRGYKGLKLLQQREAGNPVPATSKRQGSHLRSAVDNIVPSIQTASRGIPQQQYSLGIQPASSSSESASQQQDVKSLDGFNQDRTFNQPTAKHELVQRLLFSQSQQQLQNQDQDRSQYFSRGFFGYVEDQTSAQHESDPQTPLQLLTQPQGRIPVVAGSDRTGKPIEDPLAQGRRIRLPLELEQYIPERLQDQLERSSQEERSLCFGNGNDVSEIFNPFHPNSEPYERGLVLADQAIPKNSSPHPPVEIDNYELVRRAQQLNQDGDDPSEISSVTVQSSDDSIEFSELYDEIRENHNYLDDTRYESDEQGQESS